MALASATETRGRCCLEVAPAHEGSRSAQPGQQWLQLCCSRAHTLSMRTGKDRSRRGQTGSETSGSQAQQGLGGLCFRRLTLLLMSETWRSVLCSREEETAIAPTIWDFFLGVRKNPGNRETPKALRLGQRTERRPGRSRSSQR